MNLSFGRKNSEADAVLEDISPSKGTGGFSSKLGDYGRSISGMSKKVTSAASALVMSDEKERTPNKQNLERQKYIEQLVETFRSVCLSVSFFLID